VLARYPVRIEAVASADDYYWECSIVLRYRNSEETVRTTISRWEGERISRRALHKAIQSLVRSRSGYIFVRENNGGGNAWRADVDHVFTRYKGWLIHLGTLSAHIANTPGDQFHDGLFEDVYDRLEFNDHTCHAGAPRFTLMIEDKGAQFVVNVPLTWAAAQTTYREQRQILKDGAQQIWKEPTLEEDEANREAALFCLGLTSYCSQDEAYASDHELVLKIFGNRTDEFDDEVNQITPGELSPVFDP